ncbi:unnamed protein product, partial [Staurois parvus]
MIPYFPGGPMSCQSAPASEFANGQSAAECDTYRGQSSVVRYVQRSEFSTA